MSIYTDTFGGTPVQPADVSYRAITLSASTELSWPSSNENTTDIATRIMDVTPSAGSLTLTMPPADQVSTGMDALITNRGSVAFTVADNDGNTIIAIGAGQSWYLWISDNTDAAGTWRIVQFGTGTSSADAGALAGYGLVAFGLTLNQSSNVSTKNADYTILTSDRAATLVNTGGSITFALTAAATLGSNWFCQVKNRGSGTLTIDPNGAETIDGSATLALASNESCILVCDGSGFYTVGYGRTLAQTAFTRLVKAITSSSVTLTSSEAGNVVQEYTGTLSANTTVIVPTTVARFYVYNNTTASGYTLTVSTASGTGYAVAEGTRKIVYCDGTNVVNAVDAGSGTVTNIATGSGLTGGPITTSGTISLANTTVTSGSYLQANITVDSTGRLTSATNGNVVENARTDNYTTVLGDAFKLVSMNNASAKTISIPLSSSVAYPVGTFIGLMSRGAGDVTITGTTTAVTILSEGSKSKLFGQYAVGGVLNLGGDTWVFGGNRKT